MIELKNVCKQYKKTTALKNLNLTIEQPGIYCLLGKNGAGKTTLLKAIAGYHNITEGFISVDKMKITTASLNSSVTYVENFAKHFNFSIVKLLHLTSKIQPDFDYEFALNMMHRFELDEKKKFKQLSLGMKTMVCTIICLCSNKKVILLDEPVLGLDVFMRAQFYELLQESFAKHPRIIIISTHLVEEIAKSIQNLIILNEGKICFYGTLQLIESKAYRDSGLQKEVKEITKDLMQLGQEQVGGFVNVYIFDTPPKMTSQIEVQPLSLQDFFIWMIHHQGGQHQ